MNPLSKYKEDNPHIKWKELSEETGIPVQTFMSLLKKDKQSIGGVTIATADKIKKAIGVDLINYYTND